MAEDTDHHMRADATRSYSPPPELPHTHASQTANPSKRDFEPRFTAGMPLALALVLGTFAFIAVLLVLSIGTWTGYRNTVDLLQQKASLIVSSATNELKTHLDAAEEQTRFIGAAITSGSITPTSSDTFVAMLQGALAATPQISGLYFITPDYRLIGAERTDRSAVPVFAGLALDPDIRHMVAEAQRHHDAYWGKLTWRDEWRALQVTVRLPVWLDQTFLGVVMANVSVPSLSAIIADMQSAFGYHAFILVNHRYVLAHPLLQFGFPGLDRWRPMPTLTQMGDPVLMGIWESQNENRLLTSQLHKGNGHAIRLGDESYIFLYQQLSGYGPTPWLVGTYLPASDLSGELRRLVIAIILCLAILVLVLMGAVVLGQRISHPARVLARQARLVKDLDLDSVRPVPGSYFRELNDAAQAFNAMLVGLRWFQSYVPKTLVRRLITAGLTGDNASEERSVTVLFTDIRNFTTLSSKLTPAETATFLNHHFALITDCVLATGGTVDKFIGDAVMAFWGAPDHQNDHAARALITARAIARALRNDEQCRDAGLYVRMGIHTGPAVVGNIGSQERLNYTLVGQTVITAHRIEQFGKSFPVDGADSSLILASRETLNVAGQSIVLSADEIDPVGSHRLPGLGKAVDLVRIHSSSVEDPTDRT